ncbi:MAG: hypothetical protein WCL50_19725, partial [Spirochaetota bacterium]
MGFADFTTALCFVDAGDHLAFLDSRPGLAANAIETDLRDLAVIIETHFQPAFDEEFGYICSRVAHCGQGLQSSVLLHLPALSRAGLLDRMLKTLLAEGWSLEGYFGSEEGSAGDLWVLEPSEEGGAFTGGIESAALRIARGEGIARAELLRVSRPELFDLAGRAIGTLAFARVLPLFEALSLLSDLRLG